ncbi:MAG: family 16 glycosylhydrolase [Ferruginibacter sp.]
MHLIFLSLLAALLGDCSKGGNGGGTQPPVTTNVKISINDVYLPEGNVNAPFAFLVTLDKSSTQTITVNYATTEGLAKAGEDFTPVSQTVTFLPNETQKTVNINVVGDDIREGTDDFQVVLSSPVNATILKATGIANILNDDSRVPFTNAGYDAPTSYPGYTLAWADEFNGSALNTGDWSFENGDGCPGNCGWGNSELEYYQPSNTVFQDGKMIIEARPENVGGKPYTSSKILTRGKKIFKYGRIDFRAKLTKGKGAWPAFWLLPQDNVFGGWPKSGEIDIMENIGHEPSRTYGTLHFGPGPGSTQLGRNYNLPTGTFNDEFHVFSLEWKQNSIKWLVDGNVYSTYTNADFGSNNYPFNENFFIIINLAVGGNWPGNPDVTTYFPQWLIVDYVRVYQ